MLSLHKTCRKYFGECMCVTQELDDLLSSPVLKESVIANCDCRILLDMRKYANKFDEIQELLGLSDKERNQVLSINRANDPMRRYKEVWIGLGGVHSAVYATETSLEEYPAIPPKRLKNWSCNVSRRSSAAISSWPYASWPSENAMNIINLKSENHVHIQKRTRRARRTAAPGAGRDRVAETDHPGVAIRGCRRPYLRLLKERIRRADHDPQNGSGICRDAFLRRASRAGHGHSQTR